MKSRIFYLLSVALFCLAILTPFPVYSGPIDTPIQEHPWGGEEDPNPGGVWIYIPGTPIIIGDIFDLLINSTRNRTTGKSTAIILSSDTAKFETIAVSTSSSTKSLRSAAMR